MDREIDPRDRRSRIRRRVFWTLAGVAALGSLYAFASDWLRPSLKRSAIRVGTVTRGSIEATLSASGTVVPAAERTVASPVDGRLERVLRRPGDVVAPGEEILELDTSATKLELERLDEQIAQNRNERGQKELELSQAVAELESRIETQRLDRDMARLRLKQSETLHGEGLLSDDLHEESKVAASKAAITLRQLEDQLAAERRLDEARLEGLDLNRGILEKERADARRRLDLATTAAPVAGVISYVFDQEGAAVGRGDVLARIADLASFRVEARVSDAYATRLAAGQDAWVLMGDEKLAARVDGILPSVEEGTVRFTVALSDPSHAGLRQNLRVDVLVVTGRRENTLLVPRGPFIEGGGSEHEVFVVAGDRAVRTGVVLGLAGHESYEVVGGLREGDSVILSDVRDVIHASEIRLR